MIKVTDLYNKEYDLHQFITGGDGKIYGICYHKNDDSFTLVPYSSIKPITKNRMLCEDQKK